jgi:hypothetical protein
VTVVFAGCPAPPSAKEEYDAALKEMNAEQARLDALLPSYAAAKQTAMAAVCKELAGVTPDEAQAAALEELRGLTMATPPTPTTPPAGEKKQSDIDNAIDSLISAHGAMAEQSQALLGKSGKVAEVMKNIQTPGTPEAKRFEEVLGAMPEVQAYTRQEQRLAKAKQAVLDAEAKLPDVIHAR